MGFRGRGQIDPRPQHILVFKYPSRDRVNTLCTRVLMSPIEWVFKGL